MAMQMQLNAGGKATSSTSAPTAHKNPYPIRTTINKNTVVINNIQTSSKGRRIISVRKYNNAAKNSKCCSSTL